MPLHNVTATSLDHTCVTCGAARQCVAHAHQPGVFEHVTLSSGAIALVAVCEQGHRECFNMKLTALDEVHPDYSEEHHHQAGQIRQLQQHLGLPVK